MTRRFAQKTALLSALVLPGIALHPAFGQMRTWHHASGSTVEAEFVEERLGQVTLCNAEGERTAVRLNRLSRDDQLYVASRRTQRAGSAPADGEKAVPEAVRAAFGEHLVDARGKRVSTAKLEGKKIGLYFSAQWCPPCRAFTPRLVQVYEELKAAGKPFEIVLVSHDRTEADMAQYMQEYKMPWLAVPFQKALRDQLGQTHGIQGIPALIIVDSAGKTLSKNGRREIQNDGAAAFDRW